LNQVELRFLTPSFKVPGPGASDTDTGCCCSSLREGPDSSVSFRKQGQPGLKLEILSVRYGKNRDKFGVKLELIENLPKGDIRWHSASPARNIPFRSSARSLWPSALISQLEESEGAKRTCWSDLETQPGTANTDRELDDLNLNPVPGLSGLSEAAAAALRQTEQPRPALLSTVTSSGANSDQQSWTQGDSDNLKVAWARLARSTLANFELCQ
jgi:hypothetical protein